MSFPPDNNWSRSFVRNEKGKGLCYSLEGPLHEEEASVDDEDDVEEGEGEQEVVEEAALLHGG